MNESIDYVGNYADHGTQDMRALAMCGYEKVTLLRQESCGGHRNDVDNKRMFLAYICIIESIRNRKRADSYGNMAWAQLM